VGPESATQRRAVVLFTAGLWALIFVLFTLRSFAMAADMPVWPQVLPRLITCVGGALICLGMWLGLRPFAHRSLAVQLPLAFVASLIGGTIDALMSHYVAQAMMPELMPEPKYPFLVYLFLNAQSYSWVFLTWCGLYLAVSYSHRLRDNELRLLETQALAADAQNRMLRYQINPHFLFNTLNAISSLVLLKQTDRAEQMLMALSGFLRYSLARAPDELVPLREEAEAQEEYLRIEQARFGDRLNFVLRLTPEAAGVMTPSLILQPLIENAVKYAVAVSSAPVTVELVAERRQDGAVVIEVCDDGPGAEGLARGLGVGLENVRRRLEVAYGGRALFEAGPRAPRGFCARIVLPEEAS